MSFLITLLLACGGSSQVNKGPKSTMEAPSPEPEPEKAPEPPPPPPKPVPPKTTLEVSNSAAGIANQLALCENIIRNKTYQSEDVGKHGHLQQRIYRALAKDPTMEKAVIELLPEKWKEVAKKNTMATREIAGTVRSPRKDLPDWSIVDPVGADELLNYYKAAEKEFGVPWSVLASVHLVETRMGRLRGTSYAGAQGPMQFMPKTWDAYGTGDIQSNRDAIFAAGNYLGKMMGPKKDVDKAIWHYNHSDHYVKSVKAYASILDENPDAYRGYHSWEVYYRTVKGSIWLHPGYEESERISIAAYCERKGGEPYCPANP